MFSLSGSPNFFYVNPRDMCDNPMPRSQCLNAKCPILKVTRTTPYPQHSQGKTPFPVKRLSVGLRHTLQLVLLLDSVRVAASLGSVDQLLSKALSDRLDVAERSLAGTGGEQGNGLVDAAERGHIDGLPADGTGGTNTGRVFAGAAVDNSVDGNLDGVLVGHQVNDLESVGNNADSHELLSVVATVHHERVGQTLNDRAVGLAESLGGISAGGVGDVDRVAQRDVVSEGDVADLDIVVPLVEELDVADLLDNILGENVREDGVLDLDITAVRHVC
jgi:hypothetical protein